MSRRNNRHSPDNEPKKNTAEPLLVPRLLSPREQVVRILAEGIWEMVLAGKAPKRATPGASTKHSLES